MFQGCALHRITKKGSILILTGQVLADDNKIFASQK